MLRQKNCQIWGNFYGPNISFPKFTFQWFWYLYVGISTGLIRINEFIREDSWGYQCLQEEERSVLHFPTESSQITAGRPGAKERPPPGTKSASTLSLRKPTATSTKMSINDCTETNKNPPKEHLKKHAAITEIHMNVD